MVTIKETHKLIDGEVIQLVVDLKVHTFLKRVVEASVDPQVDEITMTALVYGSENPILRTDILPGQGVVTREAFENPAYRVMVDLLGRKRAAIGVQAPAGSEYTMTVTEAAKKRGLHPSAVRQAIAAKRLEAKKLGGTYFLRPTDIEAFRPVRRGPAARSQLTIRHGNVAGESFRVKIFGGSLNEQRREGHVVDARVDRFDRAVVLSGGAGKYRFFEIEPGDEEEEISFGRFYLRGRVRVLNKVNNPIKARAAWKAASGNSKASVQA